MRVADVMCPDQNPAKIWLTALVQEGVFTHRSKAGAEQELQVFLWGKKYRNYGESSVSSAQ